MTRLAATATVAVIGAGAMGAGIAQVAAKAGHPVWLYDIDSAAAERGRASIAGGLERLVQRGKIDQFDSDAIVGRIRPTSTMTDLANADLVIEAIVERLDIKQSLFREIEAIVGPDAVLTSNTSSLSITAIAQGLQSPQRFAGLHFFNPAPVMQLVEVVSGLASDPAVLDTLSETAKAWGKYPVRCTSTPGFIVNRVARPFYAEALRLYEEGVAAVHEIDHVMREAGGFRMGPFELMDLIGHDVNFAVTSSVFAAYFSDPRYRPSLAQQELVSAGWLGRKSGRGFYLYGDTAIKPLTDTVQPLAMPNHVLVEGDLGIAEPLVARLEQAGVEIVRAPGQGYIRLDDCLVALTDGRTATARAKDLGVADFIVFDLAHDFAVASTIAIAKADGCSNSAFGRLAAILGAAGISCLAIDDAPGLLVMRTVCMLANEAAEAMLHGVASSTDIDAAMCRGVNYPVGPCAWGDAIGISYALGVIDAIQAETGDPRYRASRLLRQLARTDSRLS